MRFASLIQHHRRLPSPELFSELHTSWVVREYLISSFFLPLKIKVFVENVKMYSRRIKRFWDHCIHCFTTIGPGRGSLSLISLLSPPPTTNRWCRWRAPHVQPAWRHWTPTCLTHFSPSFPLSRTYSLCFYLSYSHTRVPTLMAQLGLFRTLTLLVLSSLCFHQISIRIPKDVTPGAKRPFDQA